MAMTDRTPTGLDEQWPLDLARARVRAAVMQAWANEALDDARVTELTGGPEGTTGAVAAAADVFALHELVRDTQGLSRLFCGFPGCFHPPRTAAGNRPAVYCEVVRDGRGKPGHTAVRSMRAKERLADGQSAVVPDVEAEPTGVRPVSLARETVPEQVARVEAIVGTALETIGRGMEDLRRQVALLGDQEAVQAEIDSVRADSEERVTTANKAKLAAEDDARKARKEKTRAEQDLEEAKAAAEEAHARLVELEDEAVRRAEEQRELLENARREVDAAKAAAREAVAGYRAEVQQAIAAAKDSVQAVHRDAAAAVQRAQEQAEQYKQQLDRQLHATLEQWKTDHDTLVEGIRAEAATAVEAADTKVAEANTKLAEAEAKVEQAGRDVAAANARTETANTELDRVRVELAELRSKVERDEKAQREALAKAADDVRTANAQVTDMQRRLDDLVEKQRADLDRMRDEFEQQAQRERRQRDDHDRTITDAHNRQVQALELTISTLREALEQRQSGTRDDQGREDEPPAGGGQSRGKRR
ncbi:hypothetical protein ACFXGA_27075 [Actinosynnema sp. NPDC059335]|uniref:hypothetical protein n=1 Tax=Actinosynnema sp. NPDC059335 TaxID=3346804 RepID=UPI003671DC37